MKAITIPIEVYGRAVVILQGNVKESIQWLKDEETDNETVTAVEDTEWSYTDAVTVSDGTDAYIVVKEEAEDRVIVHELLHATSDILKIIGIDFNSAEEAYAYLLGYLYAQWREAVNDNSKDD